MTDNLDNLILDLLEWLGSSQRPYLEVLDAWRTLPGVESVRHNDGLISLTVREPHLTIPALLEAVEKQGSQLLHLTTRQASLEDVFVNLTGRHLREQ